MTPVQCADCMSFLASFDERSVDAIVTDPPYEIGFNSEQWDRSGIAFRASTWEACRRVLKPGGWLAAFGGDRTHHRLMCAIEDAGLEIRQVIPWISASAMPKVQTLWRLADRAAGIKVTPESSPVSEEARRFEGWATGLKKAWEPIVIARRPLEATTLETFREHGTGAMRIDDCRVPLEEGEGWDVAQPVAVIRTSRHSFGSGCGRLEERATPHELGRYPSNVILTHAPECGGECHPGCPILDLVRQHPPAFNFFPTFKYATPAARKEKEAGLEEAGVEPTTAAELNRRKPGSAGMNNGRGGVRARGDLRNPHPTCKPIALMRWLVRLLAAPGALVVDPFAGSGTTGIACALERIRFSGCDLDDQYVRVANARIAFHERVTRDLLFPIERL